MSRATKKRFVHRQMETEFVLPTEKQYIAKVIGSKGNNLHEILSEHGGKFLASMPMKFRNTVWVKRDQFVIVEDIEEGDKVKGEIVNVLDSESILHIEELGSKRNLKPDGDLVDADMLPPSESDEDEESEDMEAEDEEESEATDDESPIKVYNPNRKAV
ncbi:hypothetical protein FO519_005729 [Halicephalobus sp. NKZ332]|nr:hypothetical protein FO519_005729 [Halicephalobus sp. NKZ332]